MSSRQSLRRVIAVARGAHDSVLFECGHRRSLNPVRGRRRYLPQRYCFGCENNHGQAAMSLEEWEDAHKGWGSAVYVFDKSWQSPLYSREMSTGTRVK